MPTNLVAGLETDRGCRTAGQDLADRAGRLAASDHEQDGEEDDGEDEVRRRAGDDHGDPLPGSLPPVRVGGEPVAESPADLRSKPRRPPLAAAPLSSSSAARAPSSSSSAQGALEPLNGPDELGRVLQRPAEVHVDVGRRRPVHPGDLHVAAQRDRADPVLDSVPVRLHERGREADVEPPRAHPDGAGGEEVAGLVDRGSGTRGRGSR